MKFTLLTCDGLDALRSKDVDAKKRWWSLLALCDSACQVWRCSAGREAGAPVQFEQPDLPKSTLNLVVYKTTSQVLW